MTILRLERVQVEHESRPVVRGVSFAAARGERVALMGASGTGKTTILRAIAGLDPIAGGTIAVDGVQLSAASTPRAGRRTRARQQRVGMVFQFHHLFAHMTALQNVWLAPVHVSGESRLQAEARARSLLGKLGVGHRAEAMPHELSGGEAQRVAIARALAVNPPLLLMDEPTASLDAARRGELAATLRELSADGTTLLVATHDTGFARAFAQRVLVLEDGRVTREGTAADVLS